METPLSLLEHALHHPVTLVLKDARRLSGTLVGYDEHINLVLEGTEEMGPETTRTLGRVVVRGNNVISIHVGEKAGKAP